MQVCLLSALHWLEHANSAFSLAKLCSVLRRKQSFCLGCFACTCRPCTHPHESVESQFAPQDIEHIESNRIMMQALLQCCILPAPPKTAACRNRPLHQRLHHSAAASHQLPLPQEAAARGGAPGQGQVPAVPEASSPGVCSGPVCGSADLHQALRHRFWSRMAACELPLTHGRGHGLGSCECLISWAIRYNTWLFIKLTPKGVVLSFLLFSFLFFSEWLIW